MARRESMIFYASWLDAISELPVAVRNEAQSAILEYGIEGTMPADVGQTTKALMALIKPQIDANNVRYENGCRGGAPVGNQNARKNNQETTKNNQETTEKQPKTTYNDNVYDNDNVNVNVNDNESESDARTPALTREEEKFYQFLEWCRHYAPDSLRFREPLKLQGFLWLYAKYGGQKMKDCASDLHNKEAFKRNKNALNCWKKWIQNL